ncbi:MAG: primosomal protein N' [Oscillospiraceae bacterium]|nr:primosomal protein N' [Oscillospiraceae bacterium]
MLAKIAVSAAVYAIDKPYSYLIPADMRLCPGMRVMAPFGRGNRRTEGIVLSVEEGSSAGLKTIDQLLDDGPVLDEAMLRLAAFVRERYFCTFYDAIRAMLPAGLWFCVKDTYTLAEGAPWEGRQIRKPGAAQILAFLQEMGGSCDYSDLRKAFQDERLLQEALKYLQGKKWISAKADFLRRIGDKTEQIAALAASAEEVMAYALKIQRRAPVQYELLRLICTVGSCSVKELCYFTGATSATVKRLERLGYLNLTPQPVCRCREILPADISGEMELNPEQQRAFSGLAAQMLESEPGTALLYGVTGSGKTSVYLKLIERCLQEGKSALLLVPEISLTSQLLRLLAAWFGKEVAVLHSSLSVGERYDQWKRIRSGGAKVVVGTRSAVFAPCQKLGLIILDEEQEHTYKSENAPRYHAREVAIFRGQREKALVLLGSATPSVETMYRAQTGLFQLYTLGRRYNGMELPPVEIVDMKQELQNGNDSAMSAPLAAAMAENFRHKQQTILFLNRRGASKLVACVDCGKAPECPRCSVHLTYHSANQRLMCHYCGHSEPMPRRCPFCGGPLKQVGVGTQRVQEELEEAFPGTVIIRMDADTVSAVNTHEKIFERFQKENIPVLLGTQMVAKGLNFENVTLVGVLDGDLSLYVDHFRAAETTFNMITQVVGRAGRGAAKGRAVIQTMTPEHKVLQLAAAQDYKGFYELELPLRRAKNCPPFSDFVVITFSGQTEAQVMRGAADFRESLKSCLHQEEYSAAAWEVLGPAPAAVMKINYNFRYRLTLRCRCDKKMRLLLAHLLREFAKDKRNRGVSAFVDVNGYT